LSPKFTDIIIIIDEGFHENKEISDLGPKNFFRTQDGGTSAVINKHNILVNVMGHFPSIKQPYSFFASGTIALSHPRNYSQTLLLPVVSLGYLCLAGKLPVLQNRVMQWAS
jgi:hypothetical protein